jgi:alpha-galactosidase
VTELSAPTGLFGHNRAFGAWLDGILTRYPGLVLEKCASGAMGADYAQLQRMTIPSTSDQKDSLQYVPIVVGAPTAVPPGQSAVWAYPQPGYRPELNALTLTVPCLAVPISAAALI